MNEFEELYAEHVAAVFRYAMHCVGRRDIAEDMVSEAFLALFKNRERIDTSRLPGWLLTVVRNRATDYWRRQAVEQRYASSQVSAPPPPDPPDNDRLFNNDLLKPVHRVCLILRYVHGMNRTEIAGRIGLSPEQVKSRLQYALRVLRDQYQATSSTRGVR
jgi:RNA polymerase sigma-70 factor (ECF subfamily)